MDLLVEVVMAEEAAVDMALVAEVDTVLVAPAEE